MGLILEQSLIQELVGDLFNREYATDKILEYLFSSALGGMSLFSFIRWLRGRNIKKKEKTNKGVRIQTETESVCIHGPVYNLYINSSIQGHSQKVIAPLKGDGMDVMEFKLPGSKGNDIEKVSKKDVDSFNFNSSEEKLNEEVKTVNIQIVNLSFKKGRKWHVTEGGEPFYVDIEDNDFLAKIEKNEISFSHDDILVCEIKKKQTLNDGKLKIHRIITRIIEHKPARKQDGLFSL